MRPPTPAIAFIFLCVIYMTIYFKFFRLFLYLFIDISAYKKTLKNIIKHINNNPELKSILYNQHNYHKYKIKDLIKHLLYILKSGVSCRLYSDIMLPHWNTMYKLFLQRPPKISRLVFYY